MTVPLGAPDASDQRPESQPDGLPGPGDHERREATPSAREAVAATCPYLTSVGGSWRQATPSRDHRCSALEPPAPQPPEKQRRHCLSPDHLDCPIFRAARGARAAILIPTGDAERVAAIDSARRPIARTSPILLERPSLVDQAVRLPFGRGTGQIALVGLMIVAFLVVAITRLSASAVPPGGSVGPSQIALASPSPSPTEVPTASPSFDASASPPASPPPSFRTTYTVKKGDTLTSIARRFKTTAAAIKTLNRLTSSTLHTGQVLKIP